ncbi:spore coat protein YsxE [Rossellomorea vietnamensis]|uniref:Spore coat protein YsxE n=1 Tax=Rossellomorea vietnamensis TaxID=218284 RepID=A0A5D4MGC0_9BACI|nr:MULTISPECIES: spore coat protein YsxE [Bacillaceae]TYS00935.1 spore coat protein YsxE [Rossellomorea vietnamensis]
MAIDQNLTAVLKAYGVQPHFAEEFGRVKKVYTEKGTLAVKKIPAGTGVDFVRNVQHLFQSGYHRIVPIYPTLDGRYAVWQDNDLYYVMPWLANEVKENRFERHQTLFRELARLHTLSSKEQKIGKEEREEHYETVNARWEKEQGFLEEYIELCEKEWYMSPFQLSYCMYYGDASQALKFSRKKFDSWYEESKDLEKVRSVVVHGKISSEHFLYDDRGSGFFSNFEQTRIASPIHDLLPFLSRTLKTYPKAYDECFDWLMTYCSHFSFRSEEKLLFLSYLAYPSGLISVVKKYHDTPKDKRNEVKFLRKLQQHYWLLKNTEYIVMKWEEWEQRKKEAQQQAQEGASSS